MELFDLFDDTPEPKKPQSDRSAQKKKTRQLLKLVKENDCDHEWYPSKIEHLQCIKDDLIKTCGDYNSVTGKYDSVNVSLLDLGAGEGRALCYLTDGKRYAIEKAKTLVEAMDSSIYVIGADFHENTLLDKKVTCIFSNPPYSEYEAWAAKIIKEGQAAVAYIIMPSRWVNSATIAEALAIRQFKTSVLGSFDFLDADRVARAKVDIVKIKMGYLSKNTHGASCTDAFNIWFDENFDFTSDTEATKWSKKMAADEELEKDLTGDLVKREGLAPLLCKLYQRDLAHLMETYINMSKIEGELLRELGVLISSVQESLRMKVSNLKNLYWQKLFDNLKQITDKLCTDTRADLLNKLTSNTHVDFNLGNVVNVVIWVLKQANLSYEEQIISIFEDMTEAANVILFKSNERTFKQGGWRYNGKTNLGPYGLDYRIVLTNRGGYSPPGSYSESTRCGLTDRALAFINDLVTISNNIGFLCFTDQSAQMRTWEPGKPQYFHFNNLDTGEREVLFEAKVFKKRTIHLRLNEKLIQKLNCIHGRLKGWLHSPADAVNEMDIPLDIAEQAFAVQLKLSVSHLPMLGFTALEQS